MKIVCLIIIVCLIFIVYYIHVFLDIYIMFRFRCWLPRASTPVLCPTPRLRPASSSSRPSSSPLPPSKLIKLPSFQATNVVYVSLKEIRLLTKQRKSCLLLMIVPSSPSLYNTCYLQTFFYLANFFLSSNTKKHFF